MLREVDIVVDDKRVYTERWFEVGFLNNCLVGNGEE